MRKEDIPRWKYWLSYFKEIRLEETNSEYHSILAINLIKGRYQLCCENAIYSFDDKYTNFRRAFDQLDFDKMPSNAKVLVLGLGLAAVPYLLEHTFGKRYVYTAVEIDEVVAELAQRYTISSLDSYVEVRIADAFHYVHQLDEQFDIIAMDVFAEDVIPNKFQTEDFLTKLGHSLTPNGIILYNRMHTTNDDKLSNEGFSPTFFKTFPEGKTLNVGDNLILVSNRGLLK